MCDKSGVLIHNDTKVLLVHQKISGLWSIPKGHSLPGENTGECWKRELFEETGLKYIPSGTVHRNKHRYNGYSITVIRIYTKNLPPVYPNDDEIVTVKWVNIKDVGNYPLNSVTSKIIYEILEKRVDCSSSPSPSP